MRLSHDRLKTHASFDDPNLVSRAGLIPVMGWLSELADGSISSEIDVQLVSLGAFGMMNSVHLWCRPDGRRSPRQIADALADLVIEGLAARAG